MNTIIDNKLLRKFGLTLAFVFMGVFGSSLPLLFGKTIPTWPWIIGVTLFVLALLMPNLLRLIYNPWMKIGHILGWVNTRMILSLIFFVMITPMGIIMRLFGYNPMERHYDTNKTSYRKISPIRPRQHMEKPF